MKPDIYWIRDIAPLRLAIMPRPRGGEWLEDEVTGWSRDGVQMVVSLLQRYEGSELQILQAESLCKLHGIEHRSFPIQDRAVPESLPQFIGLATDLAAAVQGGIAVAIHCRAGIGRSALTVGAVLLRLGVTFDAVFPMISRARGLAVPDTAQQAEWLHALSSLLRSDALSNHRQ